MENICTEFLPATYFNFSMGMLRPCRSQWPRGLRCGSTAARLLGFCVRIPLGAWMFVSCECCDRLVNRPEESYRVWCLKRVIVKPRKMRRPRTLRGCRAIGKKENKKCWGHLCSTSRAICGRGVKLTAWWSYPVCGLLVLDVLNFRVLISTWGKHTHIYMYLYNKISTMCD